MELFDNRLALFIVFVLPGFIAMKAYQHFQPSRHTHSPAQLLDAICYSCINYAFIFLPLYYYFIVPNQEALLQDYIVYLGALIIAPILGVWLWTKVRKSQWMQNFLPHPTPRAWDYIFAKRESHWVKINLNDGESIAGRYATKSFVSSFPEEEQIYLEEKWLIDDEGNFTADNQPNNGIIVLPSNIRSIEFLTNGDTKMNNRNDKENTGNRPSTVTRGHQPKKDTLTTPPSKPKSDKPPKKS